jgi:hypothetical protein
MPIDFKNVDFSVDLPDVPRVAPVVAHPMPCLGEREATVRALADVLGFDVKGSAHVPHGYAVGSDAGQVEVFAASGAVRARNVKQLTAFEDERRPWRDVERTDEGYRLGDATAKQLIAGGRRLLEKVGLQVDPASIDVVLGQWALLDEESGKELESGPGRATVRLSYAAEGMPLIGPGAKTNLHYDPSDDADAEVLARLFHVHRPSSAVGEVRTLGVEEAFAGLLGRTWSGRRLGDDARLTITAATVGLLALPADVVQSYAAPALAVEGEVSGVPVGDGRTTTVRFGEYVSLADPKALAEAGYGGGSLIGGSVVRGGRSKGR